MWAVSSEDSGYLGLANAIIVRACMDYGTPDGIDVIPFIKSEWFMQLSRGAIDPLKLLTHLKNGGFNCYGD